MKRTLLICVTAILLFTGSAVFGIQLELPKQITAYQTVPVLLVPEPGDPDIDAARFYLVQEGKDKPLYLQLKKSDAGWKGTLPGEFVTGEKLVYYAEVMDKDEFVYTYPTEGTFSVELEPDTIPPVLTLVLPRQKSFVLNIPQVILFTAEDTSMLTLEKLEINGLELQEAEIIGNRIKGVFIPQTTEDALLTISVADAAGNRAEESLTFSTTGEPGKAFFTAQADYYAGLDIAYTISSEQEGLDIPGELFEDVSHEIMLDFSAGAQGTVTAGPLMLSAFVELSESRNFLEYLDTYPTVLDYPFPSAVISDFHDIVRLWNPYAFNYTSGYGTADARSFDTGNEFLFSVSFFNNFLRYKFGDQTIHFQDQTVKDLYFRGSSFQLDLPFLLSLSVANGFTDPGISGETWPQAFIGFQLGIDVLDYWYLQTNLSLISDYQGSYKDVTTLGYSPIAELYGLIEPDDSYTVAPSENFVFGIGTGINTKWFELKGEGGLTLYTDDASQVRDVGALAASFGVDEATSDSISDTIDMVQGYFPVFDYFPISLGLAGEAADVSLWGITYGADLTIPPLNLEGWYRKTDGTYKSLGASVTTGKLESGGLWKFGLGSWGFELGYDWNKTNIPDIVINEIAPLISSLVPSIATYLGDLSTTSGISEITHSASTKIQPPNMGAFGRFSGDAGAAWERTDVEKTSSDYNEAVIIEAGLSWKSMNYKFNKFSMSLGTKTDDSYRIPIKVDGADPADGPSWDFSVSGNTKFAYDFISLATSYTRAWGTSDASDTVNTVKNTLGLKKLWFDSIGLGVTWKKTDAYSGAWEKTAVDADVSLKKTFGMVTTGMVFSVGYVDAADNADDESSWKLKISSGISL